jgi:O-antigen ligase
MTIFLFLGVFFSTSTNLRFANTPIGLSETFIFIYAITLPFSKSIRHNGRTESIELTGLALVLAPVPISILVGTIYREITKSDVTFSEIQDGFAFLYAAGTAFLVAARAVSCDKTILTVIHGFGSSTIALCAIAILDYFGLNFVIPNIWLDGGSLTDIQARFIGWSRNPNQIAINASAYLFILFALSKTSWGNLNLKYSPMYFASTAVILYLTKSTTIIIAVATITAIFIFARHRKSFFLLASAGLISLTLIESSTLRGLIYSAVINKGDGGMNGRFEIWANSLQAVYEAPLTGHGFGAHSGFSGPFERVESHNTFLDLATQGGIFALTFYLLFISLIFVKCRKLSLIFLIPLVAALLYQSSHYCLRYPLFWLGMLFPIIIKSRLR